MRRQANWPRCCSWPVHHPRYRPVHRRARHRTYRTPLRHPRVGSRSRFVLARQRLAGAKRRCGPRRHEELAHLALRAKGLAERELAERELAAQRAAAGQQTERTAWAQVQRQGTQPVHSAPRVARSQLPHPEASCHSGRRIACAVGCHRDSGRNASSLSHSPLPGACHTAGRIDCQIGSLSHNWGSPSAGSGPRRTPLSQGNRRFL
jgi:hypothetical protein